MLKCERGRLFYNYYNRNFPKFQAGQDFLRRQFGRRNRFFRCSPLAISTPPPSICIATTGYSWRYFFSTCIEGCLLSVINFSSSTPQIGSSPKEESAVNQRMLTIVLTISRCRYATTGPLRTTVLSTRMSAEEAPTLKVNAPGSVTKCMRGL
jgi:hypothetical protein